jgi:hypothetical protein
VLVSWAVAGDLRDQAAPRAFPAGDTTGVYTYAFQDRRNLRPGQRHAGGVWVTPTARPGEPLPLFVYLHGLNRDRILRRWLHGSHWDLRTIVGPMALQGRIGPLSVAVLAATGDDAQEARTIYRNLDVGAFIEATDQALRARGYLLDRGRVVFSAHSASGCARGNGLLAAVGSPAVQTILDLDCCMDGTVARWLSDAPPSQRVIVVYQDYMWRNNRSFRGFRGVFLGNAALSLRPMNRVLEHYRMAGIDVHNDIVPVALWRWLPELVPP